MMHVLKVIVALYEEDKPTDALTRTVWVNADLTAMGDVRLGATVDGLIAAVVNDANVSFWIDEGKRLRTEKDGG